MWIKKGSLSEYKSAVKSNNRKWSASLLYNHNNSWGNEVDKSNIKSFSVSDYSTDGSNITMGCVAGSKVTINLINVPKSTVALWKDGETKIKVALNLDSANVTLESVPCVIDSKKIVKRLKKFGETENRVDVTLTAYDISYLMTYNFRPSFTKGTALEFVTYIADKYNLVVGSSVQSAINLIDGVGSNRVFDVLSDLTDKQTLGYMAGCYGCFVYIDNYNEINFGWYESYGETVAADRIFESGFYVSDMEQRTIVTIETGTQNNVLTPTVGGTANGYSIKFENPYINQAQVNAIYNQKIAGGKTSFRVGKIKYKGDPLNVPGTILSIEDIENETATFYVMKRTLNYDGGLSETIECQGESESTIKYKAFSPMQQKIDKAISRLEEAAKGATDVITQTKGGVFELTPIDPDNPTQGNKGFAITATEETNRNNKIVANIGGIGFSTDGGETIDAAAIYFDKDSEGNYVGRINAELIEAGSIGADKLQAGSITADKIVTGDMANLVVADPVIYNTWNGKTYEDTSTYLTYFSVGNTASTAWGNDVILNRFYGADTFKIGDKFRFRANVIATVANLKMVVLLAAYDESGQKIVNLIDHRITLASGNQSVDFVCEVNKSVGGVPVAYHQVMVGLAPGVMGNFYFRNASLYKMTNGVLIEDGAITADKIAAGSITTDLIDSDVLTIGNISGLSQGLGDITSALEDVKKTADGAYNSLVELCVDEDLTIVDGAHIATGTITAEQLAAGSITTEKLTIGDTANLCNVNERTFKALGWSRLTASQASSNINLDTLFYALTPTNKQTKWNQAIGEYFDIMFSGSDAFEFLYSGEVYNNSGKTITFCFVLEGVSDDGETATKVWGQSGTTDTGAANAQAAVLGQGVYVKFSKTVKITASTFVSNNKTYTIRRARPAIYFTGSAELGGSTGKWIAVKNLSLYQRTNNVLIADGAITADKIEAEAVTADKLSVGTGIAPELFFNPEFEDTNNGLNGWLIPMFSGVANNDIKLYGNAGSKYVSLAPYSTATESSNIGIVQYVYLESGQKYRLSARINPYNWDKNGTSVTIGYVLNGERYNYSATFAKQPVPQKGEHTISMILSYSGSSGFVSLGMYFRGMLTSANKPSSINLAWLSLQKVAPETGQGFYSSYSGFLSSEYVSSNLIAPSETSERLRTTKGLAVDEEGNTTISANLISSSAQLGLISLSENEASTFSNSMFLTSSGDLLVQRSNLKIGKPQSFVNENYTPDWAQNLVDFSATYYSHLWLEGDGGINGNERTIVTPKGVSVTTKNSTTSVLSIGVYTSQLQTNAVEVGSKETIKKDIVQKQSVLSKIKESRIYDYKMKGDGNRAKRKTGFVIERETPEDVLSDDGEHINLYSMASINWKATQEILERLEALEQKAVNNNVEQT